MTRRRKRGKLVRKPALDGNEKVPGPSPNPATNLMIADVAVRGASIVFRRAVERGLLRAHFGPEKARDIVEGKSMGNSLFAAAVSKLAMRSVPGFLVVSTGLLAKAVVDRSLARRETTAKRPGSEESRRKTASDGVD
jgi:hypothetical protein